MQKNKSNKKVVQKQTKLNNFSKPNKQQKSREKILKYLESIKPRYVSITTLEKVSPVKQRQLYNILNKLEAESIVEKIRADKTTCWGLRQNREHEFKIVIKKE